MEPPSARVLVVDDEAALARAVTNYLEMFGFRTVWAATAGAARAEVAAGDVDLVLLDINLPDQSGFDLCRSLRATTSLPILFTSVRDSDADVLAALGAGGDDHLAKPYSLAVLLAKVQAMLRRAAAGGAERDPDQVTFGDITLRLDQGRVFGRRGEIALTGTEYRLLEHLARRADRVVGKDELAAAVWGGPVGDGTVATAVRRLREKVEAVPDRPRHIKTVWGTGYVLDRGGA